MQTLPLAKPDLGIREIGDEAIVHDVGADRVHILNGTAGWVLRSCDGRRSPAEIAEELSAKTGAPAATVAADVEACLQQFETLGLLD